MRCMFIPFILCNLLFSSEQIYLYIQLFPLIIHLAHRAAYWPLLPKYLTTNVVPYFCFMIIEKFTQLTKKKKTHKQKTIHWKNIFSTR